MSDGLAGVNSMVSDLNKSIAAAVDRVKAQQANAGASNVQEFRKDVRKAAINTSFFATDIGVLARNTTRLNVVSTLAAKDSVDFYKFRVTSKGEAAMGQIGDEGVRVQIQSKLGVVVADSDKKAGKAYDNYLKLASGELEMDRGEYTVRVSREKGDGGKGDKNYALQLSMGGYTQDFDTVAKQPVKGQNDLQALGSKQSAVSTMSAAADSLKSIPIGQSATQKLMGTFNLFA